MSISKKARAGIVAGAAIAAVSLAGIGVAASANAADSTTPSTTSTATHTAHVQEEALTGATADSVKAAVLAKYPGATITKSETDSGNGAKYEAYITKADGTKAKVLLDANFAITAEKAWSNGKGPDGTGAPGQKHRGMHKGESGTQPSGTGDNQGQHRGQHHGQHGSATPSPSASPAA